ncbi:hypothetical protein PGB90_003064 [Kerria lacca]
MQKKKQNKKSTALPQLTIVLYIGASGFVSKLLDINDINLMRHLSTKHGNIIQSPSGTSDSSNSTSITSFVQQKRKSADIVESSDIENEPFKAAEKSDSATYQNIDHLKKRQEIITNSIATMISEDMLPYSFVENSAFRKFMKSIDSNYTVPIRNTILQIESADIYPTSSMMLPLTDSISVNFLSVDRNEKSEISKLKQFISLEFQKRFSENEFQKKKQAFLT